jgi:FAD:protein FMN transferase
MASACEIQLFAESRDRGEALARLAEREVLRIEAKYSRYRAESVVSQINANAGGAPITVDEETAGLLHFAAQCFTQSDGLFDITSGVLRQAWDFKLAQLPSEQAIAQALAFVGWSTVEWTPPHILLPRRGMEIDFGGLGKEYAVDRATAVLVEQGVQHALINLGGDVRALDGKPTTDGHLVPWQVGIVHPRAPTTACATIALQGQALATSGDYERYIEIDNLRYCHVLNPRTGWPVQANQSVSVSAPLAIVAGAHTTIALLREAQALAYLEREQVPYLLIDAHGAHHQSARLL